MPKWKVREIPLRESGKNVQENNVKSRVIFFFTPFSMLGAWGSHKLSPVRNTNQGSSLALQDLNQLLH